MSRNMTGITKYKTKDGKTVYRVRYSFQGKDVRLPGTFKTITEAQEARAKAIQEAKRGNSANKDSITVERLIEIYRTHHMRGLADDTVNAKESFFKNHIKPFIGSMKISTLNKFTWLELITYLVNKELMRNSVRDIMQVVKALFNWADYNDICSNPFYRCKLPKGEKPKHTRLSIEVTKHLLSIARPIEMVILALGTMNGFRKGEMLGLWREDIDFNNNTLHIQRSWNGKKYNIKNENSRATLAMPPLVAEILKKWMEINTHFKFVFPGAGGLKPMSTPMPNYYLNTLLERGGVEHVTVHELRHSCAYVLLRAGEDMHFVQKYMRHANIQITVNLYGDLDDGVTVQTAGHMAEIYTLSLTPKIYNSL